MIILFFGGGEQKGDREGQSKLKSTQDKHKWSRVHCGTQNAWLATRRNHSNKFSHFRSSQRRVVVVFGLDWLCAGRRVKRVF